MIDIDALSGARALLFVPGLRAERFEKAFSSGADAVILDLEDSVALDAKAAAREAILGAHAALSRAVVPVLVRINSPATEQGRADLEWLGSLPVSVGVMLPKAESAADVAAVRGRFSDAPVVPIIESAAGDAAVREIAASAGVVRLAVGHIDFMVDTGITCSSEEPELAPLRYAVAMATRLHGLAPAIDGVTTALDDESKLIADAQRAARFGFGGKLCIHPRQVALVQKTFTPAEEEVQWARRVVAADQAAGGAATQVDGRMVDVPVVLQARRILARARN